MTPPESDQLWHGLRKRGPSFLRYPGSQWNAEDRGGRCEILLCHAPSSKRNHDSGFSDPYARPPSLLSGPGSRQLGRGSEVVRVEVVYHNPCPLLVPDRMASKTTQSPPPAELYGHASCFFCLFTFAGVLSAKVRQFRAIPHQFLLHSISTSSIVQNAVKQR